ncbi:hypothetical protein F441_20575 [Phytophthora nicotianae CJ01A1]|uniref:DDE-1 domain-containing protein n=2 Tax=Phytophthora nicotianae TaxID=4792 RepID=W2VY87_PHYNI|nr:hypothetical protein L914_19889 [Phytophthora nicotianae]ETP02339.1 hypothetical protein F441_20575 [Phytophthora nicotianae CJ01A1]
MWTDWSACLYFYRQVQEAAGRKKGHSFRTKLHEQHQGLDDAPHFLQWLNELNCTLRSQHRKRLLLPDSATVHGGFNAALLTNVTVAFFRPTLPENYNRWMQE